MPSQLLSICGTSWNEPDHVSTILQRSTSFISYFVGYSIPFHLLSLGGFWTLSVQPLPVFVENFYAWKLNWNPSHCWVSRKCESNKSNILKIILLFFYCFWMSSSLIHHFFYLFQHLVSFIQKGRKGKKKKYCSFRIVVNESTLN